MTLTRMLALLPALALLGETPPPETKPGEGVLCAAVFAYGVEATGRLCHPGEDAEFQMRIKGYVDRFDEYILRNTGGDKAALQKFKEDQGVTPRSPQEICQSKDFEDIYRAFKAQPTAVLDREMGDATSRDGVPTFGDCV